MFVSRVLVDLSEVVQELPVKQRLELWGRMAALLKHTLHLYPSERWISRHDHDGDDMEVEPPAELVRVSLTHTHRRALSRVRSSHDEHENIIK